MGEAVSATAFGADFPHFPFIYTLSGGYNKTIKKQNITITSKNEVGGRWDAC